MMKKTLPLKSIFSGIFLSGLLAMTVVSCACSDNRKPKVEQPGSSDKVDEVALGDQIATAAKVNRAVADIHAVGDSHVSGQVTFTRVDGGIQIVADISGLKPGKHGFHAHEHGDCSGHDGMAAGGHFNPTNSKHGGPDSEERHVGDFGNLSADEAGNAHYDRVDHLIAFEGPNSILDRSIVIHADEDDFTTQPTGNSGARIGCGIIKGVVAE